MDKFESKAKEILAEVEQLLAEEKVSESSETQFGIVPPVEETDRNLEFLSVLLKAQTLFYCTDPAMPLYVRSVELEKGSGFDASRRDYEIIKLMLMTYLEFLEMLRKQ